MSVSACIVCGARAWTKLPDPHPASSMRSDGAALPAPLNKVQCGGCALVRTDSDHGDTQRLYDEEYSLYGNLFGAEAFDVGRREAVARSIADTVAAAPARVLEVGCGNGSTMTALREIWSDAEFKGLEPAGSAVEMARDHGLDVDQGFLSWEAPPALDGGYDLVYNVHVLEHTEDPVGFLRAMASLLSDDGTLVIRVPDAEVPHVEMVFADHIWGFLRYHAAALLRRAGLHVTHSCADPAGRDKEQSSILAATRSPAAPVEPEPPPLGRRTQLLNERRTYLHAWRHVEPALLDRLGDATDVVCFGAAQWAALLHCYAPRVWQRVTACTIDNANDQVLLGKPVLDYAEVVSRAPDAVVVGVNPGTQGKIRDRLADDGLCTVTWDDLIAL